jgi:site-specific DNA recombinase
VEVAMKAAGKVIGYVRVSTESQTEGVSLEAQNTRIRAWATLKGYSEVDVFTDAGLSGCRADNREALQNALRSIGKGDALVVYSLSRLARSTKDTLEIADWLDKQGADLVSLSENIDTTSAAGKMIFRILAVLSEFERDIISERTKAALSHKKSKGQRIGNIPYGYRLAEDGESLEPCPDESRIIRITRRLKNKGMSLRKISRELTERGFRSRTDGVISYEQVRRMLQPT